MIIDGRALAEELYAELALRYAALPMPARLGIIGALHDPVIAQFVAIKRRVAERLGVVFDAREIGDATTDAALATLAPLSRMSDGIIVQLPLPQRIDTDAMIAAISLERDIDGIAPRSRTTPPVALAVAEILQRAGIVVAGKRAVVLGAGRLVGAPCAKLLRDLGALVTVVNKGDSLDVLQDADIIVAGAGNPGFIKPEHIKEGVVLIDAGTSEQVGKVVGDIDPACAAKASLYTPVPGGVGPVAVAMIFKNLLDLIEKN